MAIRNIPKNVLDNLEASALRHDRSVEAEARQALAAWVEPIAVEAEQSKRAAEVGTRLMRLLEQLNDVQTGEVLRPSEIAERLGEPRAGEVENWFLGRAEPTFEQLDALAKLFAVSPEWIKHGKRTMFPVEYHRLPENAHEALKWLSTWEEGESVEAIHLLREASTTGSLMVVKESARRQFKTFHTGIHVSEEIGNGGESMLAHLWVTLALLYKRYTRGRHRFMVFSYIAQPGAFQQLKSGQVNALTVLHDCTKTPWWEDAWDTQMYLKASYWKGWKELCERVNRVIAQDGRLGTQMEAIRRGDPIILSEDNEGSES
jgi:plasmid stability protein